MEHSCFFHNFHEVVVQSLQMEHTRRVFVLLVDSKFENVLVVDMALKVVLIQHRVVLFVLVARMNQIKLAVHILSESQ